MKITLPVLRNFLHIFGKRNYDMIDDNSIKANIYKRRKQKGLTQKEMAEQLGMDRTSYRNIERGNAKILGGRITEIAKFLEISTEELVFGYIPEEGKEASLQDYENYFRERVKDIIKSYEARIDSMNGEASLLKEINNELRERIKDKEEIINLFKKRLEKLENKKKGEKQ